MKILILVLIVICSGFSFVLAQNTTLNCSPCGETEAWQTGSINFSVPGTSPETPCNITVHYKARFCPLTGEYEGVLERLELSGSGCVSDVNAAKGLFDKAFRELLMSGLPLPPTESDTAARTWRVSRPSCIKKSTDGTSFIPCGTGCCTSILRVGWAHMCGRMFAKSYNRYPNTCTIESGHSTNGATANQCKFICDDKFWKEKP